MTTAGEIVQLDQEFALPVCIDFLQQGLVNGGALGDAAAVPTS